MARKTSCSRLQVEPLASIHDRASFSCGVSALDPYLQQQAGQDLKRNLAAVFVLTADGNTVAGFYTLSAHSILAAELPPDLAKKLPRFPRPCYASRTHGRRPISPGTGLGRIPANACPRAGMDWLEAGSFLGSCRGRQSRCAGFLSQARFHAVSGTTRKAVSADENG